MMPGRDGDALMRQLAEQIENMGKTSAKAQNRNELTDLLNKVKGGKPVKELPASWQAAAKILGFALALFVVPSLRGWAFKVAWNEVRTIAWDGYSIPLRELSFRDGLALSFAAKILVTGYRTPKGK